MPNVLVVPALEFSDPVAVIVLMKCNDFARGHMEGDGLMLHLQDVAIAGDDFAEDGVDEESEEQARVQTRDRDSFFASALG